jgi:hypothetical protein
MKTISIIQPGGSELKLVKKSIENQPVPKVYRK